MVEPTLRRLAYSELKYESRNSFLLGTHTFRCVLVFPDDVVFLCFFFLLLKDWTENRLRKLRRECGSGSLSSFKSH